MADVNLLYAKKAYINRLYITTVFFPLSVRLMMKVIIQKETSELLCMTQTFSYILISPLSPSYVPFGRECLCKQLSQLYSAS